jgi:hypothetical protein
MKTKVTNLRRLLSGTVLLLAFSVPAQNLLVTEQDGGNVYEFTPDGKKSTVAFGLTALSLTFDNAGNLYVGNFGNIAKFGSDGTESTLADGLIPLALACDSAGDLFAADYLSGNIYEFTPDGKQSTFASGLGFEQDAAAMTFDKAGNLFVWDGDIYEFKPDGTQTTVSTAFSLMENNGLACDSAGNLFVADGNGYIYKLTPGGMQSTFGSVGSGMNGLVFNSAGDLFVANGDTIYEFTPAGVRSTFASGVGSYIGDLAFNSAGDLFAAGGNVIYKFTPDGGQSTFASSLLSDSYALAVNCAGDLFVGNSANSNIVEITPRGEQGIFASGLNDPTGLAFNRRGDLFVANGTGYYSPTNGYIVEITPHGEQSIFVSGLNPAGLAFNCRGDLFVADEASSNIYAFTPGGSRSTFASGFPFYISSGALAFNDSGDLFVTDYLQPYGPDGGIVGSITKIASDGAQTTFFAPGLSNSALLFNPSALAVNRAGNLFVSDDSGSGDVYELTPDGTPFVFASGLVNPGGLAFAPESEGEKVYLGNPALPFLYSAAPDGVPPLVIMGEYSPAGPLPTTTQPLPSGIVKDVKFYGQNYDFTLYALSHISECSNTNEEAFRVVAAQHFSGTNLTPGTITLAVSNFCVRAGDFLAFAGIGPWYPQQPNDATNTDATYEDSNQPVGYDNDTATPPVLGEKFTVGLNRDTNATYGYIADNFGNQGRIYAIGVDVLKTKEEHRRPDFDRFNHFGDDDPGDYLPPDRNQDSANGLK